MKKLYFMRHGQTLFNVRRRIQGACDSPLTEKGILQAKAMVDTVASLNIDGYFCSTAERASDTLEIVTNYGVEYTRLKGIKERDFGMFEGESEDLNPKWENGYDDLFPHYGGETTQQVKDRVVKTCREIMEKEHHNVLAVSHGGATAALLQYVLSPEKLIEILNTHGGIPNCCILELNYDKGEFEFVKIHLPPEIN